MTAPHLEQKPTDVRPSPEQVWSALSAEAQCTELEAITRYLRTTNYLAAAQLYLKANFLLEEPLKPEHIKDRRLGHWGTCPGINLVYAHLNHLILRYDCDLFLVTGPGHGAPATLANLYLEGTIQDYYPELTLDQPGLGRFIKRFSWPGGFPSHLYPGIPGTIHEGGELGYALATAFGAAMDNPDVIVACCRASRALASRWWQACMLGSATRTLRFAFQLLAPVIAAATLLEIPKLLPVGSAAGLDAAVGSVVGVWRPPSASDSSHVLSREAISRLLLALVRVQVCPRS